MALRTGSQEGMRPMDSKRLRGEAKKCIYCSREFDPAETAPEHIVLASLGGKRSSRSIVCAACNRRFGSELDRGLADTLGFLRTLVLVPRSRAPTARATGVTTSHEYRLRPSRGPELLSVEWELAEVGKGGERAFRIKASPQRAQEIIEGLRRKHKAVRITGVQSTTYREPIRNERPFELGPLQHRCVAKMAFNALAIVPGLGTQVALMRQFDEFRRFVTGGSDTVHLRVLLDLRNLLELAPVPDDVFCNRIAVWCNPDCGNAVAMVEILSELKFSVLLASQYDGPRGGALFLNYPHLSGRDKIQSVSTFPTVETSTLLERGSHKSWLRDSDRALRALLKRCQEFDAKQYVGNLARAAAEGLVSSGINAENVDRWAEFLARQLIEGNLPPGREIKRQYADWDDFIEEHKSRGC